MSCAQALFRKLSGVGSKSQLKRIHSTPWDFLIVLDACRYDVLAKLRIFFTKGITDPVQKVISSASETCSWLQKTFPDKYPFTVYSGSPFISSRDSIWSYKPHQHFKRIVDVWDAAWDEVAGTVLPKTMTVASQHANPRSIIWFMQPHQPYITTARGGTAKQLVEWKPGDAPQYNYAKLFDLYVENLKLAWKAVNNLVFLLRLKHPDSMIVITSDHGELLGEYDQRGHPANMDVPELREVPWIEVSK